MAGRQPVSSSASRLAAWAGSSPASTSQLRLGGPQDVIAPMLGLACETGSILNVDKKYLRDGIDLDAGSPGTTNRSRGPASR